MIVGLISSRSNPLHYIVSFYNKQTDKTKDKMSDGSGKHGSKKRGAIARGLTKVIFAKPIAFAKKFQPPKPTTSSHILDPEDEKYILCCQIWRNEKS